MQLVTLASSQPPLGRTPPANPAMHSAAAVAGAPLAPAAPGRAATRRGGLLVTSVATPSRPPASNKPKRSKVETIKEGSDFLRHPLMQARGCRQPWHRWPPPPAAASAACLACAAVRCSQEACCGGTAAANSCPELDGLRLALASRVPLRPFVGPASAAFLRLKT